jgi:CheY-like chemotaxis protein
MTIALLDDDPKRIGAMLKVLSGSGHESVVFARAPEMITWLAEHLPSLRLLSLDHDLGPLERVPDSYVPPGTGRDVVDVLIRSRPTCPVIVHSSNDFEASGMIAILRQAGWAVRRVIPTDDLSWIESSWARCVQLSLSSQPHPPHRLPDTTPGP